MSIIENVRVALDTIPQGSAILIFGADGEPLNVGYRCPDKDGNLSWGLAGKPDPFTSYELARIIHTRDLTWTELEVAL